MTKVSIIIPVYNAEKTILETIQSVQSQSFTDWELIVIDDGSSDNTVTIIEEIQESRLQLFCYENAGATVARNRGLAQAQGNFIAFLDADDLWSEDKLVLQLVALQKHPDAGVAYCWTSFIDEQGKVFFLQKPVWHQGNVYPELLLRNFLACGSIPLIRKEAIAAVGEFDPHLKSCQDWEYWLRLAKYWSFVLVPQHLVFYRQSSGSISSKIEERERASFIILEKAFHGAPQEFNSLKPQSFAYNYRYLARLYLQRQQDKEGIKQAVKKLAQAVRINPKILGQGETWRLFIKLLILTVSVLTDYSDSKVK